MPRATAGLDPLFDRLRSAASDDEAESIQAAILHIWANSGRPEVDALMVDGLDRLRDGDAKAALADFDQAVRLAPRFAEGWNLRGTARFLLDDYSGAVIDLERTLALEPRHFGALAGLGRVFLALGRDKAALQAFRAALAINPHLDGVRSAVEVLEPKVEGMPI